MTGQQKDSFASRESYITGGSMYARVLRHTDTIKPELRYSLGKLCQWASCALIDSTTLMRDGAAMYRLLITASYQGTSLVIHTSAFYLLTTMQVHIAE